MAAVTEPEQKAPVTEKRRRPSVSGCQGTERASGGADRGTGVAFARSLMVRVAPLVLLLPM